MNLKLKLLIALCCFSNYFFAQENNLKNYGQGIVVGHIDTLFSDLLNEERELLIYLPENWNNEDYKRKKYPVIYLLDGRHNFLQTVALVRQYAELNDTKILPEMIIVGISNKNHQKRQFDYSPTTANDPENYGGGDRFLEFIKSELFPYMETHYPAAKESRTFIGHSFGGVAVLNAISRYPEMFRNYVAIDASIWFDNELFLNDPEFNLKEKTLSGKNLFVGIANTSTYGSTLESIVSDTLSANKYVRHSLDLISQTEESTKGPNLKWKYYEDETHGSAVIPAQLDALRFFYSWFEFEKERIYQGKYNIPTSKEESFAYLTEAHFKLISDKLGYEYFPTVPWLLDSANMLHQYHNLPKQAKELLVLSSKYYPFNQEIETKLKDYERQSD